MSCNHATLQVEEPAVGGTILPEGSMLQRNSVTRHEMPADVQHPPQLHFFCLAKDEAETASHVQGLHHSSQ